MKHINKIFRVAILLLFISTITTKAQNEIKDIIKPLSLTAGKTDSIKISDSFYSESYDIKVKDNQKIITKYNKSNGYLYFTPNLDNSDMGLIDFELEGETYSYPYKSRIEKKYKFSYKPDKEYKKLTLFGSFNGWDRGNLPLTDNDGDGVYEAEVALEPGRYEYKFFGDGTEIVDPVNPDKKPNGMGDYNSLFFVKEEIKKPIFLHVDNYQKKNENICFSFVYENGNRNEPITYDNLIPLINNKKIAEEKIKIDKNRIAITVKKGELKGDNLIRLAVSQSGDKTNLQSIYLQDGKPIGNGFDFNWHDATIYSLMIDRFYDGNKKLNNPIMHDSLSEKANYNGGDFAGVIKKLKEGYFKNLGINTIWISPVYDNPNGAYREYPEPHRFYTGYHGYWPISSDKTEEQFGTMEELKIIVAEAKKQNIKILLDFVSHHVHKEHPLFKEHPDWFGTLELPDGRLNLRLWDEYRLTTWFEPYLPSFDFTKSQEGLDFMVSNAIWWLKETGAAGYRHDAVKHVPNEFWRELTRRIKKEIEIPENRTVYQIGETFGSYDLISSYVNNGQLNAQFNFNLYDTALPVMLDPKSSFSVLDSEMKKSFNIYGENHLMGNIMDSHDKNRFMSFADGDLDLSAWSAIEEGWNNPPIVDHASSYKKGELYYAYMHSIPGLPVVYYGSEFGMTGASDPDNRRMMRFAKDLSKDESKMLGVVSKIINIRKNHSALRYGDFNTLEADTNIYAYIRSDMNERVLVVLNKTLENVKVELSLPEFYKSKSAKDLMTNKSITISGSKLNSSIEGYGFRFYLIK